MKAPRKPTRTPTKPKRPRAKTPPARPLPTLQRSDSVRWLGRLVVPFYP